MSSALNRKAVQELFVVKHRRENFVLARRVFRRPHPN